MFLASSESNSESEKSEESKDIGNAEDLDAESSEDLKSLFAHHNNKEYNTTKPLPTEQIRSTHEEPSASRTYTSQTTVTTPLSQTVSLPVESEDEPAKNSSFLQASLGEINPSVPELNQVSSVKSEVSHVAASNIIPQNEENVTEKVSITVVIDQSCSWSQN